MSALGYGLVLALSRVGLIRDVFRGQRVDGKGGKSLMWRWVGGTEMHFTHSEVVD